MKMKNISSVLKSVRLRDHIQTCLQSSFSLKCNYLCVFTCTPDKNKGNSPWDQILFTTATNRGHPSLKVLLPLYIVGRQSAIGLAILVTAALSLARVLRPSSEQFMKGTHSHQSFKTGNGTVTPHPCSKLPLPSGFGPYIAPAGGKEYPSVDGGEIEERKKKLSLNYVKHSVANRSSYVTHGRVGKSKFRPKANFAC